MSQQELREYEKVGPGRQVRASRVGCPLPSLHTHYWLSLLHAPLVESTRTTNRVCYTYHWPSLLHILLPEPTRDYWSRLHTLLVKSTTRAPV